MSRLKEVKGLVLHVSASQWGTAADIDSWHKARGWSGIGYHNVVLNGCRDSRLAYAKSLDGKIEPGRDEEEEGAHCKAGGMNNVSLGLCLIGNPGWAPKGPAADSRYTMRPYLTARQLSAAVHWAKTMCLRYSLDPLGTFEYRGKKIAVISQHSNHDPMKPVCASLNLPEVRRLVVEALKG